MMVFRLMCHAIKVVGSTFVSMRMVILGAGNLTWKAKMSTLILSKQSAHNLKNFHQPTRHHPTHKPASPTHHLANKPESPTKPALLLCVAESFYSFSWFDVPFAGLNGSPKPFEGTHLAFGGPRCARWLKSHPWNRLQTQPKPDPSLQPRSCPVPLPSPDPRTCLLVAPRTCVLCPVSCLVLCI